MRPRELPEITSLPIFKAVHSPRDRDYLLEKSCLKVV